MSKLLDLLNAISNGKTLDAQKAFDEVMEDKAAAFIDAARIRISKETFGEKVEDLEPITVEEEVEVLDELSQETLAKAATKMHADANKISKAAEKVKSTHPSFASELIKKAAKRKAASQKAIEKIEKKKGE